MTLLATPTLRLLNCSTVVAISGGLRLHIAFLLAGIAIRIPEYIAFSLIIYATYTLDRALDCKEDAINKSELTGADGKIGLIACILAFVIGTGLLVRDGIFLAPILPFIIGYFYSRGLTIGSFSLKLKGSLGVKNLIVGVTWGGTIALIVGNWTSSVLAIGIIFLFFAGKTFITSCINDFKDVRGDVTAGIRTLPASLGEDLTKKILILILLSLHAVLVCAFFLGMVHSEWIVVIFGLLITTAFLLVYSSSFENNSAVVYRKMREFVISWEPVIGLTLRAAGAG